MYEDLTDICLGLVVDGVLMLFALCSSSCFSVCYPLQQRYDDITDALRLWRTKSSVADELASSVCLPDHIHIWMAIMSASHFAVSSVLFAFSSVL